MASSLAIAVVFSTEPGLEVGIATVAATNDFPEGGTELYENVKGPNDGGISVFDCGGGAVTLSSRRS